MTGASTSIGVADDVRPSMPEITVALAQLDPAATADDGLVEQAAGWEQVIAWATARQHDVLVELARRPDAADADERAEPGVVARTYVCDELAPALRTSSRSVQHRLDLAVALVDLPRTRARLRDGRIDLARARVMVTETACLDAEDRRRVDEQWASRAESMTPARLRRGLRRAVVADEPKAAAAREKHACDERRVVVTPADDGMAELWALLPAIDAVRIRDVLTATARGVRRHESKARAAAREAAHEAAAASGALDDPDLAVDPHGDEEPLRTLDQLRADLLSDVFRHAAATGELPGPQPVGAAVEIQVHAAVTTLLGLDDEPGLLAAYGPLTAAAIRELEPSSRLRRLLVEPRTGTVLDVGTTSYRPPEAISRHVRAVHPTCTFPGCEQPARRSELDHVIPFPLGPTSVGNLRPRCKRHHLLKHYPGVRVDELPDGTTRWHLATGIHDNTPEPLLPVLTRSPAAGPRERGPSTDDPPF